VIFIFEETGLSSTVAGIHFTDSIAFIAVLSRSYGNLLVDFTEIVFAF